MKQSPALSGKSGPLLVTGATGFLGSYLYPLLEPSQLKVFALTRQTERTWGTFSAVRADLANLPALRQMARRVRPRTIVHLAAKIPTRRPADDNSLEQHVQENLMNSINLIQACRVTVKHMIYASTIDVYGPTTRRLIDENNPTLPVGPYGATKLAAEHLLRAYCRLHGIQLTVLRFSQVYGYGEKPIKVIPTYVDHVLQDTPGVLLGQGEDRRDFLYAKDAARAIWLAINHPTGGIYNIGAGQSHSIREVINTLTRLSGHRLRLTRRPRTSPPTYQQMSIKRARAAFGYQPQFTLSSGLEETFFQTARMRHPVLIIDVDGPILETRFRLYAIYTSTMRAFHRTPLSLSHYWKKKRERVPDVHMMGTLPEKIRSLYDARKYARIEAPSALKLDRLQPGAASTLRSLARNYRIVFMTLRQNKARVRNQLEYFGVLQYADCLHVAGDQKRAAEAKAQAIRSCIHFPASMVVIGDSEIDIETAKILKMPSVAITNGIRTARYLRRLHPTALISSLVSLPKKLNQLSAS